MLSLEIDVKHYLKHDRSINQRVGEEEGGVDWGGRGMKGKVEGALGGRKGGIKGEGKGWKRGMEGKGEGVKGGIVINYQTYTLALEQHIQFLSTTNIIFFSKVDVDKRLNRNMYGFFFIQYSGES